MLTNDQTDIHRPSRPDPMAGHRALATAIISRAIQDAIGGDSTHPGGDPDAQAWLVDPAPNHHWFTLAGIGPFQAAQLSGLTLRSFRCMLRTASRPTPLGNDQESIDG